MLYFGIVCNQIATQTERQNESLMGMYSEKRPLHFHNCEHNLPFSVVFTKNKQKDKSLRRRKRNVLECAEERWQKNSIYIIFPFVTLYRKFRQFNIGYCLKKKGNCCGFILTVEKYFKFISILNALKVIEFSFLFNTLN